MTSTTVDSAATARQNPLERLLRPLTPSPVVRAGERITSRPTWLSSGDWRLFAHARDARRPARAEEIARFALPGGREMSAWLDEETASVSVPFDTAEAYWNYVSEAWTTAAALRGLSSRQLDLFYRIKHLLPRSMQLAARRRLIRWQGQPPFPVWPLDTSVSRLLRFYAYCGLRAAGESEGDFVWFWPDSHRAALILTHDVEAGKSLALALELADLEEELGFRSSFNLGAWYPVDHGFVQELTSRGFEVGSHGLTHDRSLFSSRQSFETQLPALRAQVERLGAEGFRSPATHRVFDWLADLPVLYDCTVPNSDPFEPQPGGCCNVMPFLIGAVVELPYTLPQDHTLLTLLGHRSLALWVEQAAAIEREHGLIHAVSHPDKGYLGDADKRARYAEFLRAISERPHVWKALPREVAAWWRQRDSDFSRDAPTSCGRMRIGASPEEVVFEPPAASAARPVARKPR